MQQSIKAGKTFGDVPFDELFMLGLERDNDLLMRGHIGTRDGKRAALRWGAIISCPTGRPTRTCIGNGIFTVKLGPFWIPARSPILPAALGSHEWLWDVGAQAK